VVRPCGRKKRKKDILRRGPKHASRNAHKKDKKKRLPLLTKPPTGKQLLKPSRGRHPGNKNEKLRTKVTQKVALFNKRAYLGGD